MGRTFREENKRDKFCRTSDKGRNRELEEKLFRIRNIYDHNLWWCNECGWADYASATDFTDFEARKLGLPIDGEWIRI